MSITDLIRVRLGFGSNISKDSHGSKTSSFDLVPVLTANTSILHNGANSKFWFDS